MLSRVEIKSKSKIQLNNNWKIPVLLSAILMIISMFIERRVAYNGNSFFTILLHLVVSILSINLSMIYINIAKSKGKDEITFKDASVSLEQYLKCAIYSILIWAITFAITSLFLILSSFLMWISPLLFIILFICSFFIGGIISLYATFAITAILDKGCSSSEAISISFNLVKYSFWKVVLFALSFIGWMILSCLTLGIAGVWVLPYIGVSFANYYFELCDEKLR
ncbi:DUF975 family protein [Romboutsia ilealis]|uniref:DUF975 family protein n=1 Tax=Romboutsia faecis TaxID=2764597 RepID=A0ABR7JPF4_9FIRM|nr:DUF975 family protein [Romboutsia faecis]MBC5996799.1 DUF975 family protein [Romboutsia faecis]MRN24695.1 DUF975 family protein [Romboutsia ilealis]